VIDVLELAGGSKDTGSGLTGGSYGLVATTTAIGLDVGWGRFFTVADRTSYDERNGSSSGKGKTMSKNESVDAASMHPIVRHLTGIDFTVVAKPSEYHCDFEVFEILSREPTLLWQLPSGRSPDPTADMVEAARFLYGSVKWDGCSNWHFDIQDDCMIHFCSSEQAEAIGALFRELYLMAAEMIPTWDR